MAREIAISALFAARCCLRDGSRVVGVGGGGAAGAGVGIGGK